MSQMPSSKHDEPTVATDRNDGHDAEGNYDWRNDPLEHAAPVRRSQSRIIRKTLAAAHRLHASKHLSDAGLAEFIALCQEQTHD
jgi:hypothetical protein